MGCGQVGSEGSILASGGFRFVNIRHRILGKKLRFPQINKGLYSVTLSVV